MKMTWKLFGLVPLAIAAIVALGIAACGDDDDADAETDGSAAAEEALSAAQVAGVTAAMATYRVEVIHDIDDSAQKASEIEAGWSGSVERMRQVTVGTPWPEELEGQADELAMHLSEAEAALDDEDLEAFKEHIGEAHAAWHDLEPDAYAWVAGEEAGEHADEGDDHGDEGDASPEATGTDDHGDESEASPEATH